jgi:VWFA-related protein
VAARIGAIILCTLLAAAATRPQQGPAFAGEDVRPAAQTGGAASGEPASPVRVTAVVTDRRGRPLAGLGTADFEVLVDGAPQPVERVDAGPAGRLFVFVLDEFHVSAGEASERVRAAVSRFIDQQLGAGDLVFVLKPLDPLPAVRFTADRDGPREAANGFAGRKGDYTPRTPFETSMMARAPAMVQVDRARIVTAGLREVIEKMGTGADRRGAIALVSDGFTPPRGGRARLAEIGSVVRAATRFDIPIYTFVPLPVAAVAEGPPAAAGDGAATLRMLAEQTGGLASITGTDLFAGLQRMAREMSGAYAITYRPAHASDGRYRALDVRAPRRDVSIRARPGHWASPAEVLARASAAPAPPRARQLRRSPLIQPWLGMTRAAGGRVRVTLTWQPGRPSAWARTQQPATILVKAATPGGESLFEGAVAPVGGGGATQARTSAIFETAPGRVELDLTILGQDGTTLDADARDVEVPELTGTRPMILAPALVRARTAREFREALANPDAPPVPERVFRRTDRLLIRVPAYDAGGAPLPVRARLVNRIGQTLWEIPPVPDSRLNGVTQLDLVLAPLAPGEYGLEFSATGASLEVREIVTIRVTS